MASDSVHTAEINLKELTVKTVTLGPQRATVVGEILDVPIKPGPNEITIYGLDPEVDLDSIRVTGRGPATIMDIQTEVVPQREQFEDVYPSDSDEEEIIEEKDPDDDLGVDRSELTRVEKELKLQEDLLASACNDRNTANASLDMLDSYGKSMKAVTADVAKMAEYLQVYQKERERLSDLHQDSKSRLCETQKEIDRLSREKTRVENIFCKAKAAAAKPERLEVEKKRRALSLRRSEKQRVRRERMRFWPRNVAKVVLHLDGVSDFTPGSSRRNSIASTRKSSATAQDLDTVSFSLNYVTTKATWSPRYELNLETPTSSGKVVYRAEYHNYSSETWRDTHLILSTSQTSFSGIDEKTPTLAAWNVKLCTDDSQVDKSKSVSTSWQGGLENKAEVAARSAQTYPKKTRSPFGDKNGPPKQAESLFQQHQQMQRQQMQRQQMQQQQMQQQQMQQQTYVPQPQQSNTITGGLFGSSTSSAAPQTNSLFGAPPGNNQSNTAAGFGNPGARGGPSDPGASAANNNKDNHALQDYQNGLMMLEQQNKKRTMMARQESDIGAISEEDGGSDEASDCETETLSPSTKALTFQETSRQDYGLTTTYDIPGTRTIRPSSLKRRHVIAELNLSNITFSHVIVPKLRAAAFLRARITNTSSISLLRGKAGLTLDGTFLGTTTVPNCSPDSVFNLSLGVDPGIQVNYAKPTVRRATSGFFNKEDCAIFTRVCRVTNTKTTPVSIAIHDQVPVSEDERLRVGILQPKGLSKEGDYVKIGEEVGIVTAAKGDNSNNGSKGWGNGSVGMGKGGNVIWRLTLEKGKAVKLTLEYEAKIPSGQMIVGLDGNN